MSLSNWTAKLWKKVEIADSVLQFYFGIFSHVYPVNSDNKTPIKTHL